MSAYVNQSNLKIRFYYMDSYGWYWCIDNISITGDVIVPVTWSPIAGLYTDAAATLPYTGGDVNSVYANPVSVVTYTATATNNYNCTATATSVISGPLKTVNLNVFLEGLYSGTGLMEEARDESGEEHGIGVADHINVSLHDASDYNTVVLGVDDVDLSTSGQASFTISAIYNGNYYIAINHRNSIETVSAAPVSFAAPVITYDFTSSAGQAYGGNLNSKAGGYYAIWGGDANQDGVVDGSDLAAVDNASTDLLAGYYPEDVNGDGVVDGSDMALIDNNSMPPVVQTVKP
jgi:hypothetical protein